MQGILCLLLALGTATATSPFGTKDPVAPPGSVSPPASSRLLPPASNRLHPPATLTPTTPVSAHATENSPDTPDDELPVAEEFVPPSMEELDGGAEFNLPLNGDEEDQTFATEPLRSNPKRAQLEPDQTQPAQSTPAPVQQPPRQRTDAPQQKSISEPATHPVRPVNASLAAMLGLLGGSPGPRLVAPVT